jgi:hypothetical protein
VLSCHDSSAVPQTTQTASPVCGTKNFSSERLYSAPQLQCGEGLVALCSKRSSNRKTAASVDVHLHIK